MSRNPGRVLRSILGRGYGDSTGVGYYKFLEETKSSADEVELLIEPQPGVSLEFLRHSSSVIDLLHAVEKSTYLDEYLWLIVPIPIVDFLRDDPDGSVANSLVTRMVEQGVHRIWPNVPLEPQTITGIPLSTIPSLINATNLTNLPLNNPRLGEQITWAIIDTDVRDSHQVFQQIPPTITRYHVDAQNGVTNAGAFNSMATANHGSHMAGIFHAVAPYASIVSIALDCHQLSPGPNEPWIVKDVAHLEAALKWVCNQPLIHGVNISLAIHPDYQDPLAGQSPGCKGVDNVFANDKIVVVAAGNYGEGNNRYYEVSITDPANAYSALVAGACDSVNPERLGVCSFSSRGPTADGREKPDIVAPGVNIESCGHLNDTDLSKQDGTSQAAALVSGACALLLSQVLPSIPLRRSEVISCLTDPAGVQSMNRVRTYQGAGRLSISTALHVAKMRGYI